MVLYDEISVRGPVVRFGLLATGDGSDAYALANILETGRLLGASGESVDVVVGFTSTTGALDLRILADADPRGPDNAGASWIDDLLAPLPGERDMQILILSGSGLVVVVLLLAMVLTARRALRRKPDVDDEEDGNEEDVMLMITPESDESAYAVVDETEAILAVMDDDILEPESEEEETVRPDPVNARQERRRRRALAGTVQQPEATLVLPTPPLPDLGDLPPLSAAPLPLPELPDLPPPSREATCTSCDASFTVRDLTIRKVACPICGDAVEV